MKERRKNIYKKIMKYPITIWMIASLIVLSLVYATYAAYNGTADVKRVVSTQATSNTVFSSNYMEVFSSLGIKVKNLRTTQEGNFVCPVTVCNYDQLNPTSAASAPIQYSFTAELVKYYSSTDTYVAVTEVQKKENNVAKTFYVQKSINDNLAIGNEDAQHSINSTGNFSYTYMEENLPGGTPYRDSFEICFDASEALKDIPDLFIRVTATPTAESVQMNSGISTLTCIISVAQGRVVETGWHGSLQEKSNIDYDAYNLVIEGSGSGEINIYWDDAKFAMNPVFISLHSGILTNEVVDSERPTWRKRTLKVNSMDANRYVVQFYKRKTNTTYTGPEFPSKYIYCADYVPYEETTATPTPAP